MTNANPSNDQMNEVRLFMLNEDGTTFGMTLVVAAPSHVEAVLRVTEHLHERFPEKSYMDSK